MSTKHTPGPWVFESEFGSRAFVNTKDESTYIAIQYCDNREEMAANARLIAAAPELLEALQNCLDILLVADMKTAETETPYTRAKAAIAKATGEKEVAND